MLRCQYDIHGVINKVKPNIYFYSCSCKARDVLVEMKIKIVTYIEITEQHAKMGVTERTEQYIAESTVQKYIIEKIM